MLSSRARDGRGAPQRIPVERIAFRVPILLSYAGRCNAFAPHPADFGGV
jgi:hypothetical protein